MKLITLNGGSESDASEAAASSAVISEGPDRASPDALVVSDDDDDASSQAPKKQKVIGGIGKAPLGGAMYYKAIGDSVPVGLTDISGMSNIIESLCKRIFVESESGPLFLNHFLAAVYRGVATHHEFAGRQALEICLKCVEAELDRAYHVDDGWVVIYRTCEKATSLRKHIERGSLCPMHSFGSLENTHLDAGGREWLANENPIAKEKYARPSQMSTEERVAAADFHHRFEQHLKTDDAFQNLAKAKCFLHPNCPGGCPVKWTDSRSQKERALTVWMGGPLCLPSTRGGARLKDAHPGMAPWYLSKQELIKGKYDVGFVE